MTCCVWRRSLSFLLVLLLILPAVQITTKAEEPRHFAIRGARIVTVSGAVIESGTVVMRTGEKRLEQAGIVRMAAQPGFGLGDTRRLLGHARILRRAKLTREPSRVDRERYCDEQEERSEESALLRDRESYRFHGLPFARCVPPDRKAT